MTRAAHTALALLFIGPALLGLATAAGCEGGGAKDALDTGPQADTTQGPTLSRVETHLDRDTLSAGERVAVTCEALDQHDEPYPVDPELFGFTVVDANAQPAGADAGVTISEAGGAAPSITFTHAGSYRVRCAYTGNIRIEDSSPATVTVSAGPATSIRTSLFITDLTAGDSVTVICTAQDASGNPAGADTTLVITPDEGVSVEGRRARFIRPGEFSVACALVEADLVDDEPVAVHVSPGRIRTLRAVLSPEEISPDQVVTVSCPGEDAFGNAVSLDKVIALPVDGLEFLDGSHLSLTSTRSGTYAVECAPKEAWVHATSIPATLTVHPGAPVSLSLDLTPDRHVYNLNSRVRATPRLVDHWDNPVPDFAGALGVEARLAGELRQTVAPGERVKLDAEGIWTLSVATGPPSNLSASREVPVDASAPSIEVSWPARGQMIIGDGGTITVVGTITDATGGLAEVRINGSPQPLDGTPNTYAISYPMPGLHGLGQITIEATDTNGNRSRVAQSFLNAPGWKLPGASFAQGVITHLSADFLDDGVRGPELDDLTTIIARAVDAIDIGALLPSPVVTYGGYDIYLRDLTYDEPDLSLACGLDTLTLGLRIINLDVDIDADGFIDVSGHTRINAIDLDMQLIVSVDNGEPKVEAGTTEVHVEGLDIDVHWSINWLVNLFEDKISDSIADAFRDALVDQVPPRIEAALASFAIAQTFEVPAFIPGMQPINLTLNALPSDVHLNTAGMDLDLASEVSTLKRVPWSAPGSLMRGGCFGVESGAPTWAPDKRLGFALSTDVLNQLLFAVWWGGAMEIAMGPEAFADTDLSQYGVSDLSVVISAHMPAVLTDCLDQKLRIQLGELEVDASLKLGEMDLSVGMIIAFETEADLTLDDTDTLALSLGAIDPDAILIDIVSVDSELFSEDDEDALIDLLRDQLLGQLLEQIAGQSLAGFPLPAIDMGLIDPSLQGKTLRIGELELQRERGFIRLEGQPITE